MSIIIGYLDGTRQKEMAIESSVKVIGTKKQVRDQLKAIANRHVDSSSIVYVMECKLNG